MVLAATCPGSAVAAPTDASDGPIAAAAAPVTAAAVTAALSKVGASYASGAAGPDAFDCSGLTMWALARADIAAPHSSYAQYAMGSAVPRSEIRRGDLVFFDSFGAGASHVGLATSPTTAVSATNHGVMTHPIFDAYWGGHYVGARRLG
jgi:peptidoglycan DL-endopeptidase CwlO